MCSYCGTDCSSCPMKTSCRGCKATCGSPFGGKCLVAQEIKRGNTLKAVKERAIAEINALFVPELNVSELYMLLGSYVNLEYPLPNGEKVKFLKNEDVYLGAQIERDNGTCYGVVVGETFILVSEYENGGENAKLVLYKQR